MLWAVTPGAEAVLPETDVVDPPDDVAGAAVVADEEEIRELHPDLASPWPTFVIDRVKQPPPRRRGRPPKTPVS